MEIIKINEQTDYSDILKQCLSILKNGGVILLPTDTVYGLVCLKDSSAGIKKIFDIKNRPVQKKLPVIVSSVEELKKLPIEWNSYAEKLANKYWPGALTLALKVKDNNEEWLEDRSEIAVRIPNNKFIIELSKIAGPLLMTSANKSGEEVINTVDDITSNLYEMPDIIIDGGKLNVVASTLVNVNSEYPKIEREGVISSKEIMGTINGK